ncbi:hypothetical protein [Tropicimonas isoalkanivorans]|uniref:Response regulatory domain-containing protein n=1 Tax=Tropicimonas isoalkanivorans TaxID=441112 RepID=A0A1I1JH11_9RHOB|nr:hypothetical protein [Tropicimonas isoalkanivorans]SFC47834.1 hypothetical protein SAMN04488094_105124 [Tropicimonas isoalkanivorans]
MNRQLTGAVKSFVILTQHFIEAIDLTEALNAVGPAHVTHIPTVAELLALAKNPAFSPDGAFLAGWSVGPENVERSAKILRERGTRLVLIDGEPEEAHRVGALHLMRPFGASELEPIIAAIRAD